MCPKCNIFIEKESGCNRMVCEMCNFEFCWLCLKKYEFYHYYVFNATGCPGMRYGKKEIILFIYFSAKSTKSEVFENWFLNYLWYFLVIILSIIAVLFLVGFYLFFGASYEFVKCYLNSKNKRKDNKGSDNIQNNKSYPTKSDSNVTIASNDNEGGKSIKFVNLLIIFSLIICGIAVQPFFLMFKFLEGMMECYRTYGCLFFWFFW